MNKRKKIFLIIGGVIITVFVLILVLLSPIAKYLVEKYDVKYTGREINLDWAYVNPLTGYIHLHGLNIHECDSDSSFLYANGLSVDFAMLKLLSSTYEISSITLDEPKAYAIQHGKYFNFDDLIHTFSGSDKEKDTTRKAVRFSVLDIAIKNGEFHYTEDMTPINYYIKNVTVESKDGYQYDVDSIPIRFTFLSGLGEGKIDGNIAINISNSNYRLAVKVEHFDLEILNQYIKDLTNYGTFAAILDADIESTGNFTSKDSLTTNGSIAVSDFHFGKSRDYDFASFEKFAISIHRLSPKDFIYEYDSVHLSKPFFRYERYDSLDNIQTMFGRKGENVAEVDANPAKFNLVIELAKLIRTISRNFLQSPYKIDRLAIYDGDIQFVDYSLGEKFSIALNPLSVFADSVDKSRSNVSVSLKSGMQPYGALQVSLRMDPKDTTSFEMRCYLNKIPLAMFNPFSIQYTSFPIDRGAIEFSAHWEVKEGMLSSRNHLIILDPRNARRIKNKDSKWIPLPLAFAIVRENGNVVDYEIPITGNLKDPKFNLWDVVLDALKNVFVKPVMTPYRMEVKSIEREIEKSISLKWPMQKSSLTGEQKRMIKKVSKFLKENPESKIHIQPMIYADKEKEFILFYEAKKKFYLATNKTKGSAFSDEDSVRVSRMSIKDKAFVHYVHQQIIDTLLFSLQHKVARLIPEKQVELRFEQLKKNRENAFMAVFKEDKVDHQVVYTKSENIIPFNGFSAYTISYKGEFPEYVKKAYEKLQELDNEKPRDEYLEERERNTLMP